MKLSSELLIAISIILTVSIAFGFFGYRLYAIEGRMNTCSLCAFSGIIAAFTLLMIYLGMKHNEKGDDPN